MNNHHQINRLRIALSLSSVHADQYSERCSLLFHRELRRLLTRVLMRICPAGLTVRLNAPLVLDLGELPAATFEFTFCRRLEVALERELRLHLMQMRTQWQWEPLPVSRARLAQTLLATDESPDGWIVRQLELGLEHWLPVVAGYALHPEGVNLRYRLRQETAHALCRLWAPDISDDTGVWTENTLQLYALYYFQCHPEQVPPVPPRGLGTSSDLENWSHRNVHQSQDITVLQVLFAHPTHSMSRVPALECWLRYLWQSPLVRELLQQTLSAALMAQWRQRLTDGDLDLTASSRHTEAALSHSLSVETQGAIPQSEDNSHSAVSHRYAEDKSSFRQRESLYDNRRSRQALSKAPMLGYKEANTTLTWQPISHAGLVLLWPLLPSLFRQLGLLEGKRFIDLQAQYQAALCLDWLSREGEDPLAFPTISRWLCGLPAENSAAEAVLDAAIQEQLELWFAGLVQVLPATWQKLSACDMRQWFLQRLGWRSADPDQTTVYIQPAVFDVLLNNWPWPVELAALPWLEKPLTIRWTEPQ